MRTETVENRHPQNGLVCEHRTRQSGELCCLAPATHLHYRAGADAPIPVCDKHACKACVEVIPQ